MAKLLQSTSLLSLLFLLFLSGCKTQAPTEIGSGGGWGEDIIPSGVEEGWGLDSRDSGVIDTEAGMYNGRSMVEGILQDVFFSFDSYSIASSERPKLQKSADFLLTNSKDGLLIEGHCDWYGTADYNLALGDRRAKSVRDYLITLGVSEDRIETLSKGSLESTSGLSKSEAKQERRGELIVLQ
ncbi:MAG: peptidoglycan-associated lipoprotein [Lentimonas sp.]|jgi:peptidoglycan-associated lipoprotein